MDEMSLMQIQSENFSSEKIFSFFSKKKKKNWLSCRAMDSVNYRIVCQY